MLINYLLTIKRREKTVEDTSITMSIGWRSSFKLKFGVVNKNFGVNIITF